MNSLGTALVIAALFSILIGIVEVFSRSKIASLRNCISWPFFLYLLVLAVGNTASTTMIAATADSQKVKILQAIPWFWDAFLGVFGFEVLLQNINVTFLGKGLLSISDWIVKARESAIEAALKAQVTAKDVEAQAIALKLMALEPEKLNAYVAQFLGDGLVVELDRMARKNATDPKLTKALALAFRATEKAKCIKL